MLRCAIFGLVFLCPVLAAGDADSCDAVPAARVHADQVLFQRQAPTQRSQLQSSQAAAAASTEAKAVSWAAAAGEFVATDSVIQTVPMQTLSATDAAKAKAFVENLLIAGSPLGATFPLPQGVESMTCVQGQCTISGAATGDVRQRIEKVAQTAKAQTRCTDKICHHSYQTMYGTHLVPLMQAASAPKLFEIGLGCDMAYGPGASVSLWKALFPIANLWEAEYDAACVQKCHAEGTLAGINAVTGDQGDQATVQSWVQKSGGQFDAVVDDGGHRNKQIRTSFEELWPHVKPGGLYFLEDLQVGRRHPFSDGGVVMSDIMQAYVEQLLTQEERIDLPLPENVESIFCQKEACMIKKAG